MKFKFFAILAFCLLLSGVNGSSFAIEPGFISVSSSATKEVDPNRAEVIFYIETTKKTAQEASEKNKILTNEVIAAIKSEISKNETDSIKTSAFVVRPDYYYAKDNKKTLNAYVATNSIYVVTSNIQNIGRIIDLAISAGATRVDRLNLTLDNNDKYCSSVLVEAVKDSKFKAAELAKALGTSLAGVKSVHTSCSTQSINNSPYRLYAKSVGSNATSEALSTPIEAGKIKIYANVNANYNLK